MSNWIPKSRWLSPCEICGQELNQGNSWIGSSPICDECRENTPKKELDKKWAEIREREGIDKEEAKVPVEENVPLVFKKEVNDNKWEKIGWVLGGIFAIWFISAIISSRGDSSEVYIDCRQSAWRDSQYCDGTFEGEIRDQDGIENNFYQNIVR